MCQKERTRLNHERSFFENRRNCSPSELWASSTEAAYSEHSIAIPSISMAGYVNAVRYRLLSASNSQPERQSVSVIFENWPLAISSHLISCTQSKNLPVTFTTFTVHSDIFLGRWFADWSKLAVFGSPNGVWRSLGDVNQPISVRGSMCWGYVNHSSFVLKAMFTTFECTPGGNHANNWLAWYTPHVRLAYHHCVKSLLSYVHTFGCTPGGDHANLCLAWCTPHVRLAYHHCVNIAYASRRPPDNF